MTGSLNVIRLLDRVNQISRLSLPIENTHVRRQAHSLTAFLPVMIMRQVSDQLTRIKWPAFREQFSNKVRVEQRHRERLGITNPKPRNLGGA